MEQLALATFVAHQPGDLDKELAKADPRRQQPARLRRDNSGFEGAFVRARREATGL